MNDLCEDTQRHIVSLCDASTVEALAKTSKIWPDIIRTSVLSFCGPINGNTFSGETFVRNGPCFMPNLSIVHINALHVIDGLTALNLTKVRQYKNGLKLFLNLQILDDQIASFIESHTWGSIILLRRGSDFSSFSRPLLCRTKKMVCFAEDFVYTKPETLEHLVLTGFEINTYSAIFQSLFQFKLHTLKLYGFLTNAAIVSCTMLKMPSLKNLLLNNEAICDWQHAPTLQSMFPNVESFAIRTSNLLNTDLMFFNFKLWPHLKRLDFENNYTAMIHAMYDIWPKSLETFRILNCRHIYMDMGPQLRDLSISISPEWLPFKLPFFVEKYPLLTRLYISLDGYLTNEQLQCFGLLTDLKHLTILELTFKERISHVVTQMLNQVRSLCPNVLVKKI